MAAEFPDDRSYIEDMRKQIEEILFRLSRPKISPSTNFGSPRAGIESGKTGINFPIQQPIKDYGTIGNLTVAVFLRNFDSHVAKMTLNGDISFAFNDPPPAEKMMMFVLDIKQDGFGGHDVISWGGITPAPVLDTAPNARTILLIQTTDGGATYNWINTGSGGGEEGANKTLSNLESPTAINQHLIPGTDNIFDLGIFSKRWNDGFIEVVEAGTLAAFDLLDVLGNSDFNSNPLLNVLYLESDADIPATAGLIRAGNDEIIIAARNFLNTVSHGVKLNPSDQWETDADWTPNQDNMLNLGDFVRAWREINVFDLNIFGVVFGDLIPITDDVFVLGTFSPLQAWASAAIKQIVIPPGGPVNANNFSLSASTSLGIINIPLNDSVEFQEDGIPGSIGDIDATGLFFPFLNLDVETIVNRKSIFLLNFENDPILNGEFARNGADVKVMSGGLLRNLSNIGAVTDISLWSQHPALQDVDFAGFRGKNGADPIEAQDFTTKSFVLSQLDALSSLVGIWSISQIIHLNSKSIVDNGSINGIFFKPDGTKMYLARSGGIQDQDNVTEYDLTTPWDVTTATQVNIIILSAFFFPHSATPNGVFLRSDGTKMYVAITKDDNNFPPFDTQHILQYELSTPWDISTASFVNNEFGGQAVFFKPDGTRHFIRGHQIFDEFLRQTDLSTPWDISTGSDAGSFQQEGFAQSPLRSLFIRPDGQAFFDCRSDNHTIRQWVISTPWDITTLSLIQTKDISADVTSPQGIFWKPDGRRIFVINSGSVHTYAVGFE